MYLLENVKFDISASENPTTHPITQKLSSNKNHYNVVMICNKLYGYRVNSIMYLLEIVNFDISASENPTTHPINAETFF